MKKCIMILGVPGTGKTTIMRSFITQTGGFEAYEPGEFESAKLIKFMRHKKEGFYILGIYDDSGEVFQGTDRFSMSCQTDFGPFLDAIGDQTVIFEGDRLATAPTIDSLQERNFQMHIIHVVPPPASILKKRFEDRGSDQSKKFLDGRATKVARITSRMDLMEFVDFMPNTDHIDLYKIVETITEYSRT